MFLPVIKSLHEKHSYRPSSLASLKIKMLLYDILTGFCSPHKIIMLPKTFLNQPPVKRYRGCNKSKPEEHLRDLSLIQQLMIFKHMVNVSTFLNKDKISMCLTQPELKQP